MTNKLDFPKGKANQGEDDVQCAIREIKEEIDVDITPFIRKDRFIQIQTMKDKWVKLFLVVLDEELIQGKLKNTVEVQDFRWISVKDYLVETLNFAT